MADSELRPHSKLTEARLDQICERIAGTGCTLKAAAAEAGISRWTLYEWITKGRQETSGPYRDALERIEAAKAQSEVLLLEHIVDAAPRDWKAAAWVLERRFPEHYSQ